MHDANQRVFTIPPQLLSSFPSNKISTCKYNVFTFIPKNLWEQFQKLANIYFLIITILQVIPEITVSGGSPTMLPPLLFVLTVTAIKDLFEDLKRRQSDKEENSSVCERWNSCWTQTEWAELNVGDFVRVKEDEAFPADLVLMFVSDSSGICYIETKNLDGEMNLKHKLTPIAQELPEDLNQLRGLVEVDVPNTKLYYFSGELELGNAQATLTNEHLLLRGTTLKNTEWIIGIVVYTGHESKLMLNSSPATSKFSQLEKDLNWQIVYIFSVQVALCIFCTVFNSIWTELNTEELKQYMAISNQPVASLFYLFCSWMLLLAQFIPISLIVSLEVVKYIQAIFIAWDLKLYHEPLDAPAQVQASNLNEQLGQVTHVFCDKTGTLTENVMDFRKFSCMGVAYGTDERMQVKIQHVDFVDSAEITPSIEALMMGLAVCHSILPRQTTTGEMEYKTSSPDELALVAAAKYFGVELRDRTRTQALVIKLHDEVITVDVLHVLEFTSERMRMSVVVQYPSGQLYLICKGADTALEPRINPSEEASASWEHLEQYASEGLRTLVVARRALDSEYFEQWMKRLKQARLVNDESSVSALAEELEQDMELLGITGVEDKLQLHVPEAITSLRRAGLKLWVLTGDKTETAVDIGYSCSLLTNAHARLFITGITANAVRQQLHAASQLFSEDPGRRYAVIITGDALLRLLCTDLSYKLSTVLVRAEVVLACRVSPQQKAELVTLLRKQCTDAQVLAIGDGANDVNMLLEANAGIGICGTERTRAVRAADFAIAQFHFLPRLIFVHGRECYRRNACLTCYNFYKNILLTMPLFYYGVFSVFSAQVLFNGWNYQLFNVLYTCTPVLLYAVFDQKHESSEQALSRNAERKFSTSVLWLWIAEAALQAFLITLVSLFALGWVTGSSDTGKMHSLWTVGDCVLALVVVVANLKILGFSQKIYWFTVLVIILSILLYFLSSYVITCLLPITTWLDNYDGRGSAIQMMRNPNTWNVLILSVVASFLLLPIIKHVRLLIDLLKPHTPLSEQYQELSQEESSDDEVPKSTYASLLQRRHTGFAYSGE